MASHKASVLGFLFLAAVLLHGCVAGGGDAYEYEPHESELRGILTVGVFYGPPGYGETPETDMKETALLLVLDSPIDVIAPEDSELNETRRGVKEVQLVIPSERGIDLKVLLNQRLRVRGTLFSSFTGHHHAPVLMNVKSISRD